MRPLANTGNKLPSPVKVAAPKPCVSDGSLWQENAGPTTSMTSDTIAHAVGDIVTILVVETVTANRSSDTSTSKTSSADAGVDQLLNLITPGGVVYNNAAKAVAVAAHGAPGPRPFPINADNTKIGYNTSRKFAGSGSIKHSDDVSATLSAQVTEVLGNGNMVIVATKEVTVSGDTQVVTLSGIIRQRDVSQDNEVLSAKLAEARIKIESTGPLNDAQKRSAIARFFDWTNLF
jgi:flagellar L-ring protein precursor FlgH